MKKKILLLSVIFSLFFSTVFANVKLHMVLFGNTSDKSIGQAMMVNVGYYDYLSAELKRILAKDGVEVVYHRFLGNECSPNNVNVYLNNISCNGDIVFFIYVGHGGRSHKDSSKFPRMCLGSNYADEWVPVSRVVDILKNKGARFQFVIADCCNSFYDEPMSHNAEEFSLTSRQLSSAVIRNLFYETVGNVCITAASPGEYGWCNSLTGSYLTYFFISTLKETNNCVTWQELFKTISDKTFEKTDNAYRKRLITNSQRPVYDAFVGDGYINDDNNIDDGNDDGNDGGDDGGNDDGSDSGDDGGNDGGNDSGDDGGNNGGYADDNVNDWTDYDNNDRYYDDGNSNVPDNHRRITRKGSSPSFISVLLLLGIAYLLLFKLPSWFRMSSVISLVVKLLGIGSIIKAFLILLEILR